MAEHTPTVNMSGLKSDGLGALGRGAGPGVPASEGEALVSWVTFPFFVSGLLASRRNPHLCWWQEFSLLKKKKRRTNIVTRAIEGQFCIIHNSANIFF